MTFLKRLSDLIRSNLNALLDQAEDPEKLLNQAILDYEEARKKAQNLMLQQAALVKIAEKKISQYKDQVAQLARKASDWVSAHEDQQARVALKQKLDLEQALALEEKLLKEERGQQETLKHGLQALAQKIAHLQKEKIEWVKTRVQAKAQAPRETMAQPEEKGLFDTKSFDIFQRMEEKIDYKEAEVEALMELLNELAPENETKASSSIKKTEEALETPSDAELKAKAVEDELSALKKKLNAR